MLSAPERQRYSRQLGLDGFGEAGQARLRASSVLVVGAGGLGTPAALYLAAAGVGRLTVIDPDHVELSNLHRQVLYTESDVGAPKVDVLARRLRDVNPHVDVVPIRDALGADNARALVRDHDLVVDGTDRFRVRYLVNDACVLEGRPNVFASIHQFSGQASVFGAPGGPCYRCVFPSPPPEGSVPSCAEAGVLGVVAGLLGTVQATEAVKVLAGIGTSLVGRLFLVDALDLSTRTLAVARDPDCPVCGTHPTRTTLEAEPPHDLMAIPEITVQDLQKMDADGTRPLVLDVRQPNEYEAGNIGGALIPLGELPDRLGEIEGHRDDAQIVVHCRSGGRSGKAVEFLQSQGFTNAVNLKGGMLAWRDEVDPSLEVTTPG